MSRLPSRRTLASMSNESRWAILDAFARDLRDWIDAVTCGIVISVDGKPVASYVRNLRRRLARVYEIADHFGDYVGQPSA